MQLFSVIDNLLSHYPGVIPDIVGDKIALLGALSSRTSFGTEQFLGKSSKIRGFLLKKHNKAVVWSEGVVWLTALVALTR